MPTSILASLLAVALAAESGQGDYFQIHVVDEQTGRGVPLMELRTVNDLRYYTDSAGLIAFREPGLMDQPLFFHVRGHGYELPADGFGFRGRKLTTESGGSATLKVKRINVAERLYRITGGGIYADSVRLGRKTPLEYPLLNAQVLGCDSIQAVVFQQRIHWFWGDTNRTSYPLGLFHAPGATSLLPRDGGLDPSVGVNLEYFTGSDGFAKATCKMPGEGPTWIDGLAVVTDRLGQERLFAHYIKVKPPLTVYRHGVAEFDVTANEFQPRSVFPDGASVLPGGHSFLNTTGENDFVYFAKPFPIVRVAANADSVVSPDEYEAYTCLKSGSRDAEPVLDRDEDGKLRFGWKRDVPPLTPELQQKLVAAGSLKAEECLYRVRDVETGKSVNIHHGAVNWNEHRQRWILIASELGGTSMLGEVWYAEADSQQGPWSYARKIVTHDKQSFYNPRHHRFFDQEEGRVIFFEGTYTHSFSGNEERTPQYEYNQVMYRLDLDDSRLNLPVAIYGKGEGNGQPFARRQPSPAGTFENVRFFACERPFTGSVAVYASLSDGNSTLTTQATEGAKPLFHAYAPDQPKPPGCVPLYELTDDRGERTYSTTDGKGIPSSDRLVGYVWPVK